MKILYKQPILEKAEETGVSSLSFYGIRNAYLKQISYVERADGHTKKRHSHTSYEFHLLTQGSQVYETEDGIFEVREGMLLMLPPQKRHRIVHTTLPMKKYAVTFLHSADRIPYTLPSDACICLPIPQEVLGVIGSIAADGRFHSPLQFHLADARMLEILWLLIRTVGGHSEEENTTSQGVVDARIELAKQYIWDNVESSVQTAEVAAYCYLSEKQLSRLFERFLQSTPAEYIRRARIRRAEELLSDTALSLKEISDRMGFANEYHFNAFFKRYSGMPPGLYRKMGISSEQVK